MKLIDIAETFESDFQDPEFVQIYLEEALSDGQVSFLMVLRAVINANSGMAPTDNDTDEAKESLY